MKRKTPTTEHIRPNVKLTRDHRPNKNRPPTKILKTWQKCGNQQFTYFQQFILKQPRYTGGTLSVYVSIKKRDGDYLTRF